MIFRIQFLTMSVLESAGTLSIHTADTSGDHHLLAAAHKYGVGAPAKALSRRRVRACQKEVQLQFQ